MRPVEEAPTFIATTRDAPAPPPSPLVIAMRRVRGSAALTEQPPTTASALYLNAHFMYCLARTREPRSALAASARRLSWRRAARSQLYTYFPAATRMRRPREPVPCPFVGRRALMCVERSALLRLAVPPRREARDARASCRGEMPRLRDVIAWALVWACSM